MFCDEFLMNLTYKGKTKKISFYSYKNINSIIEKSVRCHFKRATQVEISKEISDFIRYAKIRYDRFQR